MSKKLRARRIGDVVKVELEEKGGPKWVDEAMIEGSLITISTDMTDDEIHKKVEEAKEETKTKKRGETLVKAFEIITADAPETFIVTPIPTIQELQRKAETMPEMELEKRIKNIDAWITDHLNWKGKQMENYRKSLEMCTGMGMGYTKEKIDENFKAFLEHPEFQRLVQDVEGAIPYLEEMKRLYEVQLEKLREKRLTNQEIAVIQKDLYKLSKKAQKIIEELHKIELKLVNEPYNETLLNKGVLLLSTYDQINANFIQLKNQLQQHSVPVNVSLPDVAHTSNVLRKKVT